MIQNEVKYKCGACGSTNLVMRPAGAKVWELECDRGHVWVPVPGEEVVLKTTQPHEDGIRPHPDVHIYVHGDEEDWGPIREQYAGDLRGLIDLAVSAENLGFGWVASGYSCPNGPAEDPEAELVREFHIRVWRELMSETRAWVKKRNVPADTSGD